MGEAKRRGDFEQRKAQAIQARRIKGRSHKPSRSQSFDELLAALIWGGRLGLPRK